MIIRKIPQYNFGDLKFFSIENAKFLKEKFYLSLPEIPCGFNDDKVLLSIPNSLELKVIKRSYNDGKEDNQLLRKEGCFYFNEEDEWILQAVLHMQVSDGSVKDRYIFSLPLSAPFVKGSGIGIYFDGVWIRFMQNGEVLNENSGLDCFCESDGEIFIDDTIKDIKAAKVDSVTVTYREEKSDVSPAFYFPYGWNTNIGDVMSFSHNGIYHLIYLHDRRHHGSRNGCGAHYICQLTTENLVDWYEQEPICGIDKPWITYGTGTMVFHKDKYYMVYGLHTERYRGSEEKIEPQYSEDGYSHITFDDIFEKGGLPAGAAYSVSEDGIRFTPANKLIHAARNPSAYVNDKGGISLCCGYGSDGIYEADSFDSPFKKSENDIDFIEDSIMGNTSECPALFTWNGYKYVMVGFTGYFRTLSAGSNKLVDAAALGEYVYDGLSVPMVAEFGNDRRIIAGWVKSPMGWGGALMQRELIQEECGKLGMKWIPELQPKVQGANLFSERISLEKYKSYYLAVTVNPKSAKRLGVSLNDGKDSCVIELDFAQNRIQINDAACGEFAEPLPTIIEQMQKVEGDVKNYKKQAGENIPQNAVNYALSDIPGMDKTFTFKAILRYSKKLRSTVVDAEIAERRTLISVRDGFFPTELSFLTDGDLTIDSGELYIISSAE